MASAVRRDALATPIGSAKAPAVARRLSEEAYGRLEEMIVTLELHPGELVSEASLCAMLRLGRTPVREALKRLEAEHLLVILPKRGALIADINIEQHLLALEVRRALERVVAARAARFCTDEKRQRLLDLAEAMHLAAERNDDRKFLTLDQKFHALMTEAARNPFATSALAPLQALSRRYWYMHHRRHPDIMRSADLHAAVMRAVAAGDGAGAVDAVESLLAYADGVTREAVSGDFVRGGQAARYVARLKVRD
jgi:DNA-binding GntR family transcriptional regulator